MKWIVETPSPAHFPREKREERSLGRFEHALLFASPNHLSTTGNVERHCLVGQRGNKSVLRWLRAQLCLEAHILSSHGRCVGQRLSWYSPLILELIPELQTLNLDLALALVLENARVRIPVDGWLGNLVEVILVALLASESAGGSRAHSQRRRVALDEAIRATECQLIPS